MKNETGSGCILVVDDVPKNLEVLTLGLTLRGYTVQTANSGQQALITANESAPDLIILDVLMPGLDGYEVCKRLKNDPRLRNIPVIFVSALSETIDKVRGFEVGGVDYLSKPFEFEEVLARVQTHLTLSWQRQQIEALLVQRERAEAIERQQRLMFNALLDSAVALTSSLNLDEVLARIMTDIGAVIPHEMAMIVLIEGEMGWVASFRSNLPNQWQIPSPKFPLQEIAQFHFLRERRQPYIVPDTRADPDWIEVPDHEALRSYIVAPMISDDQLIGTLNLMAAAPGFYTADSAQRLQAYAALASLAIQNARLYEQAQELGIVQERQRLARELHDSVSQTLFSANAIAESLLRQMPAENGKVSDYVAELAGLTREAMAEMRTLLFELRPEALARTELSALVRQLCATFALKTQLTVAVHASDKLFLPESAQMVFYRVLQETLNNIGKHASATEVTVTLHRAADGVELSIRDNGCGFDQDRIPPGHLGIGFMRERAHSIAAELRITSERGQGTEVVLRKTT